MDDPTEDAREPLDDARKLLSAPVEEWTRESAEIAEGIVAAYVDSVPALLARLEAAEAKAARMEEALKGASGTLAIIAENSPAKGTRVVAKAARERALAALQGEG